MVCLFSGDNLAAQGVDVCPAGAILPMTNHGLPCMSMGFLIPSTNPGSEDNTDTPIVWRGLMVQKAVQQLLFDVDWSKDGQGLDVLVVDMPPGTGDVPLTLGQLVNVDGLWMNSCLPINLLPLIVHQDR